MTAQVHRFRCLCPILSTTPITAMGCWQCLSLSVVQLKGKHYQKTHCRNVVVDTFRLFLSCQQQKNTKSAAAVTSLRTFVRSNTFQRFLLPTSDEGLQHMHVLSGGKWIATFQMVGSKSVSFLHPAPRQGRRNVINIGGGKPMWQA